MQFGIGTWFNRAVMSSQAFSRMVDALNLRGKVPTPAQALPLREWLANGMEFPVPSFIQQSSSLIGAIYHLTDNIWIIPELMKKMRTEIIQLVYDSHSTKSTPNPNNQARAQLRDIKFFPRNRTNIMHDKFLVAGGNLQASSNHSAERLTCGSANYTTEGLTSRQILFIHSSHRNLLVYTTTDFN